MTGNFVLKRAGKNVVAEGNVLRFLTREEALAEATFFPGAEVVEEAPTRNVVIFPGEEARIQIVARDGEPIIAGGATAFPTTLAARTVPSGIAGEKLVGALGAEKATAFLRASPGLRIDVNSPFLASRLFRQRLTESPYFLVKNLGREATLPSAEMRAKGYYPAALAESLTTMRREFVNYRRRLTGKQPTAGGDLRNRIESTAIFTRDALTRQRGGPSKLSWREFKREVSRAWSAEDAHYIPEVANAAKAGRKVFDEIADRAVAVKLFDPAVKTPRIVQGKKQTFRPRVYRGERIERDVNDQFRTFIAQSFMDEINAERMAAATPAKPFVPLTSDEALEIATNVRRAILGTPGGRVLYTAEFGGGRPTKGRTLDFIPDQHLDFWLEDDAEVLLNQYVHTMAPDIELMREFGTLDFTEASKEILEEAEARINAAAPKDRGALEKALAEDLRDLGHMWELLRGTFVASRFFAPDQLPPRVGAVARAFSYMSLGGQFVVNSLPDPGNIVMHNGLLRTVGRGIVPLVRNTQGIKLVKRDLRAFGAALETVLNTRAHAIADIGEPYRARTTFERGVRAASQNFPLATLHSPWNDLWKQVSGIINHELILDAAQKVAAGKKVPEADLVKLARYTLDESMLRRIGAEMQAHGQRVDDLWLSNSDAWTDIEVRDRFRDVVRLVTDVEIVTPGVGDKPPIMSTELGKFIGQFKTFGFATIPRAVIPALQKRDYATFNGMAMMLTLGMGVYASKELLAGRELSDDPRQWIKEGVDRSGLLGFYADVNNMLEVMTRRQLGFSALMGGPTVSRYSQRNDLANLLGPSMRLVGNVSDISGSVASGEFSQSDMRTLRRMLPYQNVWYLSRLFDAMEQGTSEALGVPRDRRGLSRRGRRTP